MSSVSSNRKFIGICPFYAISNTFLCTVKPAQPTFDFVGTGSLNNDGITNNGVITVNGLEVGATWQYSMPLTSPAFSPLIAKPCTKVFTDTVMDRSVSLPATSVCG
jgi:hypothetical protein